MDLQELENETTMHVAAPIDRAAVKACEHGIAKGRPQHGKESAGALK